VSAPPRQRLLVASSNPGKLREYARLLADLDLDLVGLQDVPGVSMPLEDGSSFEENAGIKARSVAAAAGLLTLADDSGLEVDALDGAPGLHSARFGGPGLDDRGRCEHLLAQLGGVPPERRGARFVCVIAVASPAGELRLLRGETRGRILEAPQGSGGFGYDPLFLLPELGRSYAELERHEKNALSHRARAAAGLPALLRAWPGSDAA